MEIIEVAIFEDGKLERAYVKNSKKHLDELIGGDSVMKDWYRLLHKYQIGILVDADAEEKRLPMNAYLCCGNTKYRGMHISPIRGRIIFCGTNENRDILTLDEEKYTKLEGTLFKEVRSWLGSTYRENWENYNDNITGRNVYRFVPNFII